jgi:putrescine aminotransferase
MPMAKGLSSGYLPIAAVAYGERVHKTLQQGGLFSHGYTYSGHPVSCAVALANIQLMKDEGIVDRVREETAPYFHKALAEAVGGHPLVGEVRGKGLLAGIQLVKDKDTRALYDDDQAVAVKCRDHCLDNELIMRAVGQSMVASPPLVISKPQIDELVEKLVISLDRTADDMGGR